MTAAVRQRSGMLHNKYKPCYHPLASPAVRGHVLSARAVAAGPVLAAGAQQGLALPVTSSKGSASALHRLYHVQQRRLQQRPCDRE